VVHRPIIGELQGDATDAGPRPAACHFRRRLLAIATTLGCLGSLALAIDLPVARWFKAHRPPSEINRLLNFSEVFAHGTGVAVILLVAAALDPSLTAGWRAQSRSPRKSWSMLAERLRGTELSRVIAAAYGGGLVVDVIKAVVDRVRPRVADLQGTVSALATFSDQAATWAREQGATSTSDFNSFPSGHSATAAGLAAALTWKYPRGTLVFAALAAAGATQRVVSLAHYPSDACLGAAIGLATASVLLCERSRGETPPGEGFSG
jgi:membrane-associated phospholipid phosphatase